MGIVEQSDGLQKEHDDLRKQVKNLEEQLKLADDIVKAAFWVKSDDLGEVNFNDHDLIHGLELSIEKYKTLRAKASSEGRG